MYTCNGPLTQTAPKWQTRAFNTHTQLYSTPVTYTSGFSVWIDYLEYLPLILIITLNGKVQWSWTSGGLQYSAINQRPKSSLPLATEQRGSRLDLTPDNRPVLTQLKFTGPEALHSPDTQKRGPRWSYSHKGYTVIVSQCYQWTKSPLTVPVWSPQLKGGLIYVNINNKAGCSIVLFRCPPSVLVPWW